MIVRPETFHRKSNAQAGVRESNVVGAVLTIPFVDTAVHIHDT
jgi:hypothetical protein